MGVPVSQMWTVASYVLKQRLLGRSRYPLVLMLEPLFRCNLACTGCGKIQHPVDVLRRQLSPRECFDAVEECGAPIVSIPGGEPLLHPQIDEIVSGLIDRRKFVYLCTNGLLLSQNLNKFTPSKYLSFSVHIDGPEEIHDRAVNREGVYDKAVTAIKEAVQAGFRVTTNSTLFNDADPECVREMFDELTTLGVEGMMISPGYEYEKAPEQHHFLKRAETETLFRHIFSRVKTRWKFNQSPLFLDFLLGQHPLECTPWGNPTFNLFGWQRPCYLQDEGYAASFKELLEETDWTHYGHKSENAKCKNCMVHSGYEPTAVHETFFTWRGFRKTLQLLLFGIGNKGAAGENPLQFGLRAEQALTRTDKSTDSHEFVELVIPSNAHSESGSATASSITESN